MPKIWFISDTHFYHEKIIEYCNRPFHNVEDMNSYMIKTWNKTVGKYDKIYHLGDFALCSKELIADIVPQLNGETCLIKGNHDTRPNQFYRDCGFKEVYDYPIIIQDFIVLSHEPQPFIFNQMYCNVFGHVHDSAMYQTWGKNYACVCVERHNYTPVAYEALMDKMVNGGTII